MNSMLYSSLLSVLITSAFFWFNLILGVLVVGGVLVFLYLRLKREEAHKRELHVQMGEKVRELHEVRAELEVCQKAAERANRAKNEFLVNMTHELRIYLNVILGYTQIFSKDRLSKKQRKALEIIYRNSEQLLLIISDILNLSQIEARTMEREEIDFNLRRFLWNIVELIRMQAEQKRLNFDTEFSPDLPKRVHSNEKRLRQILLNLLNNAVKFTKTGGVIFRVFPITHDSRIGSRIRFEIEDTGIGIPYKHQQNIFQPFYRVTKTLTNTEGTKLGLTISQNLAHLMGSDIQITSKVGQGTLFWLDIDLPEIAEDEETVETETTTNVVVGFKGPLRKILIGDDRYENRVVLKEMLLPLGFGIIEAIDGFDVLTKAAQHRPDLILIDLTMPVLNGFEAIRHVRQMPGFEDVIVVGMSVSALRQIRDENVRAGSDDFLSKPLHFDDLLVCLQRHLKLEWLYEQNQADDAEIALASTNSEEGEQDL